MPVTTETHRYLERRNGTCRTCSAHHTRLPRLTPNRRNAF
jgi:hypothetical protein